ncbi:MAG: DUF4263 domain-containing protein [Methylotenera sp.]|nr:DUF4263 domain-containing protein [Methylotenera sp.]
MAKIDRKSTILLEKPTVITRAIFWKIPHNTELEDIHLKLGRYKKPKNIISLLDEEELESFEPKSELTLTHEELKSLVDFLQQNYEPFSKGVKAFIPLDHPFDPENANQIKALFRLPNKVEVIKFIVDNNIISGELVIGLRHSQRLKAIKKFEEMLNQDLLENEWQKWFQSNSWVLGSQFVRILDERSIDTKNISDFLMEAYDGFLDVVEIKRPNGGFQFWASNQDHGNYVPSADLIKAVTQASRYIYEVEREANSVKFLVKVECVRTVKPRCVLIFGRSNNWNSEQVEAYRIMNANYHNLSILTYDHVLTRARQMVDA